MAIAPSPVVALNRAVAVAEVQGAGVRPCRSSRRSTWTASHVFHAVRADLLRRLGRLPEAAAAYDAAVQRAGNEPERAFLRRRRAEVQPG